MRTPCGSRRLTGRRASLASTSARPCWQTSDSPAGTELTTSFHHHPGEIISHKRFQFIFGAVLLTATSVLASCSSSKAPDAPLSSAGGSSADSHPEWRQSAFTIGDNGG